MAERATVVARPAGRQMVHSTRLALPAPVEAVSSALAQAVAAMGTAPLSATLFGSAATGQADRLSDVDLALVFPRNVRRYGHAWLGALVDLGERWAAIAEPRLDTSAQGALGYVRDALAKPSSVWADAAVNGVCVYGDPLASLARRTVRFDSEAARSRRVENALRVAAQYLHSARPFTSSASVRFQLTWPGLRLAADALAGATTGERVHENRPARAVTTLAGIVGPALADRYGRLAALAADEDAAAVTAHAAEQALSLGRSFYEQACRAAAGMGTTHGDREPAS